MFLLCALVVYAASSTKNAGTGANVSLALTVWSSPGNIAIAGQQASAVFIPPLTGTDNLAATNYGFAIPGGATILGVQVQLSRSANSNGDISDSNVFLTKNGTATTGSDRSTGGLWTTTKTAVNYGGTSDLWGATLAPADVNAATFGILFSAFNNNASNARRANVFAFVSMTVTYTSFATGYSPGIIGAVQTQTRSVRGQ